MELDPISNSNRRFHRPFQLLHHPKIPFPRPKKKLELNQLSNDKKILEDPHWKANFLMIQFSKVLTGHLLPLPISCAVMLLRILHMYGCKYFKLMYRKAKTPWIH